MRFSLHVALVALAAASVGCLGPEVPPKPEAGVPADPVQSAAPKPDPEKLTEEMTEFIRKEVAAGFDPVEGITTAAVEVFAEDQSEDVLRPMAERITREMVAKQRESQAAWPAVTDCDRLDEAFADLEEKGIVGRQNFTDCSTCGEAEIGAEMEAVKKAGKAVIGYAFYHFQDTERAVEGHGLYVKYGSVGEGEKATVTIGNEIVAALKKHGLKAEWHGSGEKAIGVKLDWKRRR